MAHSGCLRPAQAVLGKMLGVIPFLTIDEGEIVAIEKVRSVERALEKLVEFAARVRPARRDGHHAAISPAQR